MIRHPHGVIAGRTAVGEVVVATSVLVVGALRFGAGRRGFVRLIARMEALLLLPVLALAEGATLHYGRIRADLERRGMVTGGNDLLIAAHALSIDAIMVTDDVREFDRIERLAVENWPRPD